MQYKDKEIRLKALPPAPPRMAGSDMHRLIKRRRTNHHSYLSSNFLNSSSGGKMVKNPHFQQFANRPPLAGDLYNISHKLSLKTVWLRYIHHELHKSHECRAREIHQIK